MLPLQSADGRLTGDAMTINRQWIAREWLYLLAGFLLAYSTLREGGAGGGVSGNGRKKPGNGRTKKHHTMSMAGRRAIARAQRLRWKKIKADSVYRNVNKKEYTISDTWQPSWFLLNRPRCAKSAVGEGESG